MIAILSVENTGTHLVSSLVSQLTGEDLIWDHAETYMGEWFPRRKNPVVISHVYPLEKDVGHYATHLYKDAEKIIVPMRDPLAALISNHDRGHEALTWREHALSFLRVMSWCGDKRVLYLPWDVQGHEQSEFMLANHLGLEPESLDWTPQNVTQERSALRDMPREDVWDFFDPAKKIIGYAAPFWHRLGYDI